MTIMHCVARPFDTSMLFRNQDVWDSHMSCSGMRLWHKLDASFCTPRAGVFFRLSSPQAYTSPHAAASLHLAMKLIEEALNEDAYLAGQSVAIQIELKSRFTSNLNLDSYLAGQHSSGKTVGRGSANCPSAAVQSAASFNDA